MTFPALMGDVRSAIHRHRAEEALPALRDLFALDPERYRAEVLPYITSFPRPHGITRRWDASFPPGFIALCAVDDGRGIWTLDPSDLSITQESLSLHTSADLRFLEPQGENLLHLEMLERLNISGQRIANLSKLTNLRILDLSNQPEITAEVIKGFKKLKALSLLSFVTDETLQQLTALAPTLTDMRLEEARFTNYETLRAFTNLETLSLDFNVRWDWGYLTDVLMSLPNLSFVQIRYDEDLFPDRPCPSTFVHDWEGFMLRKHLYPGPRP